MTVSTESSQSEVGLGLEGRLSSQSCVLLQHQSGRHPVTPASGDSYFLF